MSFFSVVSEVVSQITYKPGVKIYCIESYSQERGVSGSHLSGPTVILLVEMIVPNARAEGGEPVLIRDRKLLDDRWLEGGEDLVNRLLFIVRDIVTKMELHELDEQLKYDGKRLASPGHEGDESGLLDKLWG